MSFKIIQNNFCYSHDREQSLHLKDGPQNSICPAGSWQEYAVSCQCIHSSLCLTEKMVVPCTQTHLGLVEVFSVIALFKWLVGCVRLVLKRDQMIRSSYWLRECSANSCTFHKVALSIMFVTCTCEVRAPGLLQISGTTININILTL